MLKKEKNNLDKQIKQFYTQKDGYWLLKKQEQITLGNGKYKKIVGVDKNNLDEIFKLKCQAKKFYDIVETNNNPIVPSDILDENNRLVLRKGMGVHFNDNGLFAFDKDCVAYHKDWLQCMCDISQQGLICNGASKLVEEYDKDFFNNETSYFYLNNDSKYSEIDFKSICDEKPFYIARIDLDNVIAQSFIDNMSKKDFWNIQSDICKLDNYSQMQYESYLYKLSSFAFILDTRQQEYLEYIGNNIIKGKLTDDVSQIATLFGIPAKFIVGVVMNKYSMTNDFFNSTIYKNFSNRYIFSNSGELLNNPNEKNDLTDFQDLCHSKIEIIDDTNLQVCNN